MTLSPELTAEGIARHAWLAERSWSRPSWTIAELEAAKAGRTVSVVLPALNEEETVADVIDSISPLAWCDDAGVTCRRWNWRQATRTQLREDTRTALFILDALDPFTDDQLETAAGTLIAELRRLGPDVTVEQRLLSRESPGG